MESNLPIAIKNLIAIKDIENLPNSTNSTPETSSNRINSMGENLETCIKDIFSNSIEVQNQNNKKGRYADCFSYIGNKNNPPDIIIKNGDAIEIKKIENEGTGIALNSSYPKAKLYQNDPMLTKACKECEEWEEKDVLYIVGYVKNQKLKSLWFVYGNCYAADKEIYEKIKTKVSTNFENSGLDFAVTKEIGRLNKVDPLGITSLRIRGMWHIQNPKKVFEYIVDSHEAEFSMYALMQKEKYDSFPSKDKTDLEKLCNDGKISIKDTMIDSPNNPAKRITAKLISFWR